MPIEVHEKHAHVSMHILNTASGDGCFDGYNFFCEMTA